MGSRGMAEAMITVLHFNMDKMKVNIDFSHDKIKKSANRQAA
jgi:hypothetical protein